CSQCHVNGNYSLNSGACATCHTQEFQSTTNPNHVQAAFPNTCDTCHTTSTWAGAQFNHSNTAFPLTGSHIGVSCASCHSSGIYKGLSTACSSCHLNDFTRTTSPNHLQSGFPQQCEV